MCPTTPLEAYAEEICSSAKLISGYCSLQGHPHPSFDPQAPSVTLPPDAPLNVQQARQKIIDSSSSIQHLATEPSEYLPNLAVQVSFALPLPNHEYHSGDAFRHVLSPVMSTLSINITVPSSLMYMKSPVPTHLLHPLAMPLSSPGLHPVTRLRVLRRCCYRLQCPGASTPKCRANGHDQWLPLRATARRSGPQRDIQALCREPCSPRLDGVHDSFLHASGFQICRCDGKVSGLGQRR